MQLQTTLKIKTRVMPGHSVEFRSDRLTVGPEIEITVLLPEANDLRENPKFDSAAAFLDSLPPVSRTPVEWKLIEEEFQKERDSWDR